MRWRVVNKNGEEILPKEGCVFVMDTDGYVLQFYIDPWQSTALLKGEYMTEFAFKRDCHGNWLYEHSVFSD